jgi:hypothetical protein
VAPKLANGAPLSGWLHLTTRHLAAKTVRKETRRRAWEQEAVAMQNLSLPDQAPDWDAIGPHLDHALGELPEADRNALLLRFFEGKSAREIGRRIGVTEEAAQKRVRRALDRLRLQIEARGAVLPRTAGAAMGGLLSAKAVEAAPVGLGGMIAKAAVSAGAVGLAPAAVTGWSHNLVSILAMTKSQTALVVALAAAFAIPFTIQQSSLKSAQAALAQQGLSLTPATPSQTVTKLKSARESEAQELIRLRSEATEVRRKITAERSATGPARVGRDLPPGQTLLVLGKPARISALGFAGNATAEAALQSLLAFRRDGDVDGATGLMLFPPEQVAKWNELLGAPEQRQRLAEEMIAETAGVVMQSVAKADENGAVLETSQSPKTPEAPADVATAEIVDKTGLDERRVQFALRITRGTTTNLEQLQFGLTPTGWKAID